MPKYTSEEGAVRTVGSWRLGIKAAVAGNFKRLMIPKDAVIGIKRWGTLDYLTTKFNWLIRRER